MRQLLQKRLQLQLLFALLAAFFVAALAVIFVADSVRHAERFVITDTTRNLRNALGELNQQRNSRIASDSTWSSLPVSAQEISLRAISETVLSSFPGIEGGYWNGSRFLGYSYPTHDGGSPKTDIPESERDVILKVIQQAGPSHYAEQVLRGRRDLVVIAAEHTNSGAAWAMKRLPGEAEQARQGHNFLLTALICAALLSASGVLGTGVALHRGVSEIKQGLTRLQTEGAYGLPERRDELGSISAAINEMARIRRRLEAEIRREDRIRATGLLVSRVAHEMRNPLNSLRLSLEMLSHRLSAGRLQPKDFQMAIGEVDRMNRLLSDLLAFQQPRPPQMEERQIQPLIEHCVQVVAPQSDKAQVRLVLEGGGNAISLLDYHYSVQVLMNLLLNAIEASPAGSVIQIQVSGNGTHSEIRVSDHGPGLSAEQQEHLFEPFYTTKSNGHGLGLAVSRELARSMGGDIRHVPSEQGGATFIFTLKGISHGI
jgi:signal transduction histidine kinase